ncbi:MAG: mitochondrial 5-aminolevulinate synthase [Chaenotheca gracillima]|nr:MAG: mitochondrial 5-aminolevulinate synthase [Chaenotheca gracillima]
MPTSPPSATSSLIFPTSSAPSLSSTLSSLKRHTLSIHNRLRSIEQDAAFVNAVASSYGRPVIANERCGSWYIRPLTPQLDSSGSRVAEEGEEGKGTGTGKAGSCYFKSTDGHMDNWRLNLRRLNLHVLDIVGNGDGCIIVDSTRRGKRMPDALSKTIPIWCAVMNKTLFPEISHDLHTPPQSVSASEHSQIQSRLDNLAQDLIDLDLDLSSLRKRITKPLRPLWVTQDSSLPEERSDFPDFHPLILCTASRRVEGAEVSEGGYIQGAGDDSEGWSHGLTPEVFWSTRDLLLSTPEEELPVLISNLVSTGGNSFKSLSEDNATLIQPTANLFLAPLSDLAPCLTSRSYTHIITISTTSEPPSELSSVLTPQTTKAKNTYLGLKEGKLGSRALRSQLGSAVRFVSSPCPEGYSERKILIAAQHPHDHGIGVALAILCYFYDEDGTFHALPLQISDTPQPLASPRSPQEPKQNLAPTTSDVITKQLIQRRLARLLSAFPSSVNPARETLKAVNTFLMSPFEYEVIEGYRGADEVNDPEADDLPPPTLRHDALTPYSDPWVVSYDHRDIKGLQIILKSEDPAAKVGFSLRQKIMGNVERLACGENLGLPEKGFEILLGVHEALEELHISLPDDIVDTLEAEQRRVEYVSKVWLQAQKYFLSCASVVVCTRAAVGSKAISVGFHPSHVIVDEAAQCKEYECLLPLVLVKGRVRSSLLIGDHQQLRPITKTEKRSEFAEYAVLSLFKPSL